MCKFVKFFVHRLKAVMPIVSKQISGARTTGRWGATPVASLSGGPHRQGAQHQNQHAYGWHRWPGQ